MDSLKFENTFNNKNGNSGDLFQTFVYELLKKSDYPKLHRFQTAGKDGGIDLIQQLNGERTVIECKYIGDNDIDEAKKRWKTVKNHLETQLATQPPKEKQYKPWLKSDTPITTYLFCVSSNISNQNGFDEFEKDITDCFKNLAVSHPHLKHLENINVEIIDWSKLLQKLDKNLPLKFKWFPLAEKFGFIPIQNKSSEVSFRTFLEEESLPFYNRSKHLEKEPNAEIQSEEQLLEMLEDSSLHGHIITGNGGTGKTRLTFELGRLAFKNEWLVFRCKETVNADNLTKFAETIADDKKILLLMDYVETQKHFTDITEQVSILNDSYGFQIKYVANCRSSYYPTIRSTPNHHQVLLTSSSEALWLEQYQASVVRHILEQGGIQIEEKHLAVCKNKPILAVFLLYLHQKNQGEELESLLDGADFGKWIQKRTKMSFVNVSDFEMKLAKLAAMLPFSEDVTDSFDEFNTKLLGILANDGWIEKFQSNEWRSVHDVFADQIILSYTQDNRHFVEKFIRDIFSFAYSTNCLESAFITIQRLAPYLEVDFNKLLNAEIDKDLPQWKKIRNYLLETSLLQEVQKIDLLANEKLWEDADKDTAFQTNLGTIIKRVVVNSESLTETQISIAKSWLDKTLPLISANNFLLTWALKFSSKDMKELALNRMRLYSSDFHSHYVYTAWLDSKLPPNEIMEYFGLWLNEHQRDYEIGFVYLSWLHAKGDTGFIKKHLREWLNRHQTGINSCFIYKAWLDAKGEPEFIKEHLKDWLIEYGTTYEAEFVYKSWLDAKGKPEDIEEYFEKWLIERQTSFVTTFVYKAWLDARGGIGFIKKYLRKWLNEHGTTYKAEFIYKSWLDAKGEIEFIKEHLEKWLVEHETTYEAGGIYRSWLIENGEIEFIKEHLKNWLVEHQTTDIAKVVYRAWCEAKGETEFIKEHLKEWLDKHQITYKSGFVCQFWLEAKGEPKVIQEYLKTWLASGQETNLKTSNVYILWLKARGESEVIKKHLKKWLFEHGSSIEAKTVYQVWLEAKGEPKIIEESLKEWLGKHGTSVKAKTIYQVWLQEKGDPEFIRQFVFTWLAENPGDESNIIIRDLISQVALHTESVFETTLFNTHCISVRKIKQLATKRFDIFASKQLLEALEKSMDLRFRKDILDLRAKKEITLLFSILFSHSSLQNTTSNGQIDRMYLKWLKYHNSFAEEYLTFSNAQTPVLLGRFAIILEKNLLNISDDRLAIERFLQHFNNWLPENRQELQPIIRELQTKYPSDIWEIVKFEE
jgi:hypothetical protein